MTDYGMLNIIDDIIIVLHEFAQVIFWIVPCAGGYICYQNFVK
jgi:hypothetical protein